MFIFKKISRFISVFTLSFNVLCAQEDESYADELLRVMQHQEKYISLGYSRSDYDNVGKLFINVTILNVLPKLELQIGSVTYIGGYHCLTAGHCGLSFLNEREVHCSHLSVVFEIGEHRRKEFVKVRSYMRHPRFNESFEFDMAIITLEHSVNGIRGMNPCYTLPRKKIDREGDLEIIGYGHAGNIGDWLIPIAGIDRRGMRSRFYFSDIFKQNNGVLYTSRLGLCHDGKTRRSLQECEAYSCFGMSGGPMMWVDGMGYHHFIAIEVGSSVKIRTYKQFLLNYLYNIFQPIFYITNIIFKSGVLQSSLWYQQGGRLYGVPVWTMKDWIESHRTSHCT